MNKIKQSKQEGFQLGSSMIFLVAKASDLTRIITKFP